eukprot:scaffold324083_cov66-Tisochrysis_lutea.AAC.2
MTLFSILAKPRLGPRLVAMPLMPACVVSAPLSESPRMAASLVPDALDDAIALNSPPPSTSTFSSSCLLRQGSSPNEQRRSRGHESQPRA